LTGHVSEGLEIIRKVRQEIIENEFILLLLAMDIIYGAVLFLAGQMAQGVNHIHDAMTYWAALGNYTQPVAGNAYLGDIYLQMAMGKVTPSPGVFLKNLCFLLRTLPVAHRKARHHFEEVVRAARAYDMPGYLSKALYSLGLLSQGKKRYEEARSYFEEALKVAEEHGLIIAEKIRPALDALVKVHG